MILVITIPHFVVLLLMVTLLGNQKIVPHDLDLTTLNQSTVPATKIMETTTETHKNVEYRRRSWKHYYPTKKIYKRSPTNCPLCPSPTIFHEGRCPLPKDTTDFPYVASLNEITYVENPSDEEFRYRCAGVIISKSLFLTSKECFRDDTRTLEHYQIVAGTRYWSSKQGSYHSIEKIIPSKDDNLVLIKVSVPFPNITSIKPVKIHKEALEDVDYVVEVKWKDSAIMDWRYRLKQGEIYGANVKLVKKCRYCESDGCLRDESNDQNLCSLNYVSSGNPIFLEEQLIGIQVNYVCNDNGISNERCYMHINKYSDWINENNDEIFEQSKEENSTESDKEHDNQPLLKTDPKQTNKKENFKANNKVESTKDFDSNLLQKKSVIDSENTEERNKEQNNQDKVEMSLKETNKDMKEPKREQNNNKHEDLNEPNTEGNGKEGLEESNKHKDQKEVKDKEYNNQQQFQAKEGTDKKETKEIKDKKEEQVKENATDEVSEAVNSGETIENDEEFQEIKGRRNQRKYYK